MIFPALQFKGLKLNEGSFLRLSIKNGTIKAHGILIDNVVSQASASVKPECSFFLFFITNTMKIYFVNYMLLTYKGSTAAKKKSEYENV